MLRTSVIVRDSFILRAALRQKQLLTTSVVKKPVAPKKIRSRTTKDDNISTKTNRIAANLRSLDNKRLLASLRDTKAGQASIKNGVGLRSPNIGINNGENKTNHILNTHSGGLRSHVHVGQKKKGQNQTGRNAPKNGESADSSRNATGVNEGMHASMENDRQDATDSRKNSRDTKRKEEVAPKGNTAQSNGSKYERLGSPRGMYGAKTGSMEGVKNREGDANGKKRKNGISTAFHRSAVEANNGRSQRYNTNDRDVRGEASDSNGIEKLRQAFMKSLSADRERRQAKQQQQQQQQTRSQQGKSNNSESRLDQLLRMTKRSSPNHRNQNSNRNSQSFREKRDIIGGGRFNKRNQNRTSDAPSKADHLLKDLMKEDTSSEKTVELTGNTGKGIILPNRTITVSEFSSIVRVQMQKIGSILKDLGESPQEGEYLDDFKIDLDLAEIVALELGLDPKREKRGTCSMEAAEGRMRRDSNEGRALMEDPLHETYPSRPPVVCIMGHVDHGEYSCFTVSGLSFTYKH